MTNRDSGEELMTEKVLPWIKGRNARGAYMLAAAASTDAAVQFTMAGSPKMAGFCAGSAVLIALFLNER